MNFTNQGSPVHFSFIEIIEAGKGEEVPVEYLEATDGTKLAYYHFTPENTKPFATLIFVHGGGVYSTLGYPHLAKTLRDDFAIETYLVDLRGHGNSSGERGDCPSTKTMFEDLNCFIDLVQKEHGSLPYLGGHSSGGGLVLNYSSYEDKRKTAGYFFIAPELGFRSDTAKVNRPEFASVQTWKFIIHALSGGLFLGHSHAVHLDFPEKIIDRTPQLVRSISVNMANALTPSDPKVQFRNIIEPVGMFVGEHDEMFDTKSLISYGKLQTDSNRIQLCEIIPEENHLSILVHIGKNIGETIVLFESKQRK